MAFVGHDSADREHKGEACVYCFPVKSSDETLDISRVCSLALTGLSRYWGAARALPDTKADNWYCKAHASHKELAGVDAMVSQAWYGNEQRYVEDLLGGIETKQPEPMPEPEYAPEPKNAPAESDSEPEYVPTPHSPAEHKPSANEGPSVRRGTGPKGDGLEIGFQRKPTQAVFDRLKCLGFRWSPRGKVWWAKDSQARYDAAISMF